MWHVLHCLDFLVVVEEAPLLWGHFALQAVSPWKRHSEQQYSIHTWSDCY